MKLPPHKILCRYCGDLGYLLAKHKADAGAGKFAFKCWCTIGKRRGLAYPDWGNFVAQSEYELEPAYELQQRQPLPQPAATGS